MANEYTIFKAGQKVRSIYGEILTVRSQSGCMVFVNGLSRGWYHPSKLYAI